MRVETGSFVLALLFAGAVTAATTVPTEVQLPGTQPGEASQIESVSKCDNSARRASPGSTGPAA
jgi:hypothetical protein